MDGPRTGQRPSRKPQEDSLGDGPVGVTDPEGNQDAGPKGGTGRG